MGIGYSSIFAYSRLLGWFCIGGIVGSLACTPAVVTVPVQIRVQPRVSLASYDAIGLLPFLTYQAFQYPDPAEPDIDYGAELTSLIRNELLHYVNKPVRMLSLPPDVPTTVRVSDGQLSELPDPVAWTDTSFTLDWLSDALRNESWLDRIQRPVLIFGVLKVYSSMKFLHGRRKTVIPLGEYRRMAMPYPLGPVARQFGVVVQMTVIDWRAREVTYHGRIENSINLFDVYRMRADLRPEDRTAIMMFAFYHLLDQVLPELLGNIVPIYLYETRAVTQHVPR